MKSTLHNLLSSGDYQLPERLLKDGTELRVNVDMSDNSRGAKIIVKGRKELDSNGERIEYPTFMVIELPDFLVFEIVEQYVAQALGSMGFSTGLSLEKEVT